MMVMDMDKFTAHKRQVARQVAQLEKQGVDSLEARIRILQNNIAAQMRKNALPVDLTPAEPQCPVCQDRGVVTHAVPPGHPEFGRLFPCPNPDCETANVQREAVWEKRVRMSGVPPEYRKLTFTTWETLNAADKEGKTLGYAAMRLFVREEGYCFSQSDLADFLAMNTGAYFPPGPKNCVMLHGPVGTGKTGLMCAAINHLLERGTSVLYIRARDLLKNVQDRWGKSEPPSGDDVLRTFQDAPILAIDEFNVNPKEATDHRQGIVEDLMRHRYNYRLPTLMTANTSQDQFEAIWGLRTASVAVAMAHWIDVGGLTLRNQEVSLGGI